MNPGNIHDPSNFIIVGDLRFLHIDFLNFLIDNNLIVEMPSGGLLIGPPHKDGGIQVIGVVDDRVCWLAEFEGGEYLINPFGSKSHHSELEIINKPVSLVEYNLYRDFDIPRYITTMDCSSVMIDDVSIVKWLLKGILPQWIINRCGTKKHLYRLEEINRTTWEQVPVSE